VILYLAQLLLLVVVAVVVVRSNGCRKSMVVRVVVEATDLQELLERKHSRNFSITRKQWWCGILYWTFGGAAGGGGAGAIGSNGTASIGGNGGDGTISSISVRLRLTLVAVAVEITDRLGEQEV
jgi:hypothetical protein